MGSTQADAGQAEVLEVSGIRIPVDRTLMSEKIIEVIRNGRYDRYRIHLAPAAVEPGERVLDLGAGLGLISTAVALSGRASQVVAVEADPCVIPLIEAVHRLNGVQCVVRNAAVVAVKSADFVPFYIHNDLWASSLLPIKRSALKRVDQVPVASIGELIGEYAPTMLLLDFEVFRELLPSAEAPDVDVLGEIDFRPLSKVQLMFKTKEMRLGGVKRAFDVLGGQGFAYDPRHSEGSTVLMRKVD